MPYFPRETLKKMKITELKLICKNYSIKQGKFVFSIRF